MVGAYQFLKKYGVTIALLIGLLLNIVMYAVVSGGYPEGNPTNKELYNVGSFDFPLYLSKFLIYGSFIALALAFISQIVRDPKGSAKSLIMLIGVIVLYNVFYFMGSDVLTPEAIKMEIDGAAVQRVDAWLYLTYFFVFASIGALVFVGIWGAIRNR